MEFIVCMKMLAPDKTRKCGRVPEAMLFNYCHWETKLHVCRAGVASDSTGHKERGDTQVLGEGILIKSHVTSTALADTYTEISTRLESTIITIMNGRLNILHYTRISPKW